MPLASMVVAGLVTLLLLQGVALLVRKDRQRWHLWAGALTLTVAALTALSAWALGRHLVVVSPELGAALTAGRGAHAVRAWIVLFVLSGWLLVESARPARAWSGSGVPLLALAIVAAALALTSIRPLGDPGETGWGVFRFDMRSPALLLWGALCILQWIMIVLGFESSWLRVWLTVLLVVGCSAMAVDPRWDYASRRTRVEWELCLALGVTLLPAMGLRTLVWKRWGTSLAAHRLIRWSLRLVWLALAGATLVAYYTGEELPWLAGHAFELGIAAAVGVVGIILFRLVREVRRDGHLVTGWGAARSLVWTMLGAFLVVLLTSIDTVFVRTLPDAWNLALIAAAAIVFVELAGEGPLKGAGHSLGSILFGDRSFVRVGLGALLRNLGAIGKTLAAPFVWIWNLGKLSGVVAKVLTFAVLFVLLWELPNRNRTVVRAVELPGAPDAEALLERQMAQRIAHDIGALVAELRSSEVILQLTEVGSARRGTIASGETAADVGLRAAVQTELVEVGTLKVPLALLVEPVQRALEALFSMRTVRVSLHKLGETHQLLVTATEQSWPTRIITVNAPAEMAAVAERAAFEIVSSDPTWTRAGLSSDWAAFNFYREGLAALRTYMRQLASGEEVATLVYAIEAFRAATDADPGSALAHYHLGIALRLDQEPGAAVEALRTASAANPELLPARNALARLLVDYAGQLSQTSAAAGNSPKADAARRSEATRLWEDVAERAGTRQLEYGRAAAHQGLCELALGAGSERQAGEREAREDYHRAFFHCAVADALFARLSAESRANAELVRARAATANVLGVILVRLATHGSQEQVSLPWSCDARSATVANAGVQFQLPAAEAPARAAALFERALALAPEDPVIACNVAVTKGSRRRAAALTSLRQRPQIQMKVGRELLDRATATLDTRRSDAAVLFRAAMASMQRAIEKEPMNLDALNEYAYGYRRWRIAERLARVAPLIDAGIADGAEKNARLAARLGARESKTYHARVLSTLGEVLLEQGRAHEAIEPLEAALVGLKDGARYAPWDEIRWDLAQAYVCAEQVDAGSYASAGSGSPGRVPRCTGLGMRADAQLARVRANKEPREVREYIVEDYEHLRAACVDPPHATLADARVDVRVAYAADPGCRRRSVARLQVAGPSGCVRVWGRGFDAWHRLTGAVLPLTMVVPSRPTHEQYFVQLLDEAGCGKSDAAPLSHVRSFDTDPARCVVHVTFVDRVPPAASTQGERGRSRPSRASTTTSPAEGRQEREPAAGAMVAPSRT